MQINPIKEDYLLQSAFDLDAFFTYPIAEFDGWSLIICRFNGINAYAMNLTSVAITVESAFIHNYILSIITDYNLVFHAIKHSHKNLSGTMPRRSDNLLKYKIIITCFSCNYRNSRNNRQKKYKNR